MRFNLGVGFTLGGLISIVVGFLRLMPTSQQNIFLIVFAIVSMFLGIWMLATVDWQTEFGIY
jgi:hypothetical protein